MITSGGKRYVLEEVDHAGVVTRYQSRQECRATDFLYTDKHIINLPTPNLKWREGQGNKHSPAFLGANIHLL
jgi:hypothetical protein